MTTLISMAVQSRNYLTITVAMMTCLILLINVSFKIIVIKGIIFTASSILCPLIAALFLFILKDCNILQQRRALNQCLMALYLFSVGAYLLVNLPAAENMRDNITYQIVFENIPRKFFSTTLAFIISFYLPHCYFSTRYPEQLNSLKNCLLLVLFGGGCFFFIDFLLLFPEPLDERFSRIFMDSSMVALGLLLLLGVSYLIYLLFDAFRKKIMPRQLAVYFLSPSYHYLIGFSVVLLLICLACEYRMIAFSSGWMLSASGLIFPLVLMSSSLINELFGSKANWNMIVIIVLSEFVFDLLLMIAVVLPSPDFFNLNPFYYMVLPRRIPAATFSLIMTLGSNAFLLEKLKKTIYGHNRALRIVTANIFANSILCSLNYTVLYGGVYSCDQVFNLSVGSWAYKFIATLLLLPLLLWLYQMIINKPVNMDDISVPIIKNV